MAEVSSPIAFAPDGSYAGYAMTSSLGRQFWAFSGIRYARPPVGELRFKAPLPVEPSMGKVHKATIEGPPCLQIDPLTTIFGITGSEDCLYLNIYTHSLNSSAPVMLWVHGGGWIWGTGSKIYYGPDFLMNEDVVLITINYRLGPIGFASLENEAMTGNYGLKDIEESIRWTKRNAAAFGGDPEAITIFGQSAGAEGVTLILKGPVSGLVKNVIAMSGSSLMPTGARATGSYVRNSTLLLAKCVGCNTDVDDSEIFRCLQKSDAKRMTSTLALVPWFINGQLPPFHPVVEPGGSVPVDPWKAKTSPEIRLLAGHTTAELGLFETLLAQTGSLLTPFLDMTFNFYAPSILNFRRSTSNPNRVSRKVREFYFRDNNRLNNYVPIEQAVTDSLFAYPVHKEIENHQGPVYSYVFDYKGTPSLYGLLNLANRRTGPGHADDLVFLFRFTLGSGLLDLTTKGTPEDMRLSQKIVRMWTRFAQGLDPTPERLTGDWSRASKEGGYLLISNKGFKIVEKANDRSWLRKRLDFWSNLSL
ncbi:Esterase [Nesidiocoris tenuis]|uniref:Carboxylic ester hydrolase n=1 Tax=Nesidiocoris tenuis TaxID=355587 RepID=A0ABN7B7L7_9HEMI|nr:Esterase [Nesidiocoris tenuis]